jgi:hypothetical protein
MTRLAPPSSIDRDNSPGPGPTSTTSGVFAEICAVLTILSKESTMSYMQIVCVCESTQPVIFLSRMKF